MKVFAIALLALLACNTHKKGPYKIVVDLNQDFIRFDKDSIWWEQGAFVTTSVDTTGGIRFRTGHYATPDTIVGVKNFPEIVVIIGQDTSRYYHSDTLRLTTCN